MNLSNIRFAKISKDHIQKIYEWRNKPHMKFWDKDGISLETVEKKYAWRISWEDSCKCYIASIDWEDFWLIQYYRNIDEPEYAQEIWVTDGVSIDLFIWEEAFLWKGLWKKMLNQFTKKIFWDNIDIDSIYICHEIENIWAIKCSLASGFLYEKDVIEDGKANKLFKKHRI